MTDDETGLDAVSPETHPAKSPADLWIENKALTKRVTNAEAHAQREQTLRIALTTRVGELQEERDRLQAMLLQREGEWEQSTRALVQEHEQDKAEVWRRCRKDAGLTDHDDYNPYVPGNIMEEKQ